jgi:hypothetical protein
MPRAHCTFRQRDLCAALKAAAAAGAQVARVEVDKNGLIRLILVGKEGSTEEPRSNEWDAVLK